MRLAWFTPWPPQRTGVAGRSAELVLALAARGLGVDVFVDDRVVPVRRVGDGPPVAGDVRVQSAHEFVWRDARGQYDLVVYQMGNSSAHEFIWPYLTRWPGLTIFHDLRLHHARGHALLSQHRVDAYRRELAWSEPALSPDAAELAIAGLDGTYYYMWPMHRLAVASSRAVGVHTRMGAAALAAAWPDRPVGYVALGEGRATPVSDAARAEARARVGAAPDDVLFGVFGALTPEKRIEPIVKAFAVAHARVPKTRLVAAGVLSRDVDWAGLVATHGLADAATHVDALADEQFDETIAACDVTLHLRWPTAIETSGPWLRAIAAGRATVTTALEHLADVPALDPRTWRPYVPDGAAPVSVAVDILDEDHSLRRALSRLAADAALRARLGDAARRHWEAEHTVERMVQDTLDLAMRAAAAPAPPPVAPPVGPASDPYAYARELLAAFPEVPCM
ncbi:MAG TPA: glycosyltransferase [Vicinamibacterales bacterium]|nr:glycosyltransferase [Vicinamibacterales bacterium]